MGKMQREKGKRFERQVAEILRGYFPGATVHRSSQADRAFASDVVVEGDAPDMARAIWWECQDAREPTPRAKLEQAERDIAGRELLDGIKHAVVVWKKTGGRTVHVLMRLETMARCMRTSWPSMSNLVVVQLEIGEFLSALALAHGTKNEEQAA